MPQVNHQDSTLVIGLGRFGTAVAATLDRLGREVLAVEHNPNTVRQWSGRIPLIEADATDMEALEQLGATEFGTAVVGVASSLEASVLITSNLVELGIGQSHQRYARAHFAPHRRQSRGLPRIRRRPTRRPPSVRTHVGLHRNGKERLFHYQNASAARAARLHYRPVQGALALWGKHHWFDEPR